MWPGELSSSSCTRMRSTGCGRHLLLRCGHREGWNRTLAAGTASTACPWCRPSTPQCRRRWVRSTMFWTSRCKRSSRNSPTSRCPLRCCVSPSLWTSSRFSMSQYCTSTPTITCSAGLSGSCTRQPRKFLKFLYRCWFLRTRLPRRWLLRRSK